MPNKLIELINYIKFYLKPIVVSFRLHWKKLHF